MKLLSELQAEWLRGRYKEGRAVAVVIGCPAGGVVLTDRSWETEISAQEFSDRLQSRPQLAEWIIARTVQSTTR